MAPSTQTLCDLTPLIRGSIKYDSMLVTSYLGEIPGSVSVTLLVIQVQSLVSIFWHTLYWYKCKQQRELSISHDQLDGLSLVTVHQNITHHPPRIMYPSLF